MQIRVIPTTEQIKRALAHTYGCGVADVRIEGLVDIQVDTNLDGAKKADRAMSKVKEGSVWE